MSQEIFTEFDEEPNVQMLKLPAFGVRLILEATMLTGCLFSSSGSKESITFLAQTVVVCFNRTLG